MISSVGRRQVETTDFHKACRKRQEKAQGMHNAGWRSVPRYFLTCAPWRDL
jgi:hypothetical protein